MCSDAAVTTFHILKHQRRQENGRSFRIFRCAFATATSLLLFNAEQFRNERHRVFQRRRHRLPFRSCIGYCLFVAIGSADIVRPAFYLVLCDYFNGRCFTAQLLKNKPSPALDKKQANASLDRTNSVDGPKRNLPGQVGVVYFFV